MASTHEWPTAGRGSLLVPGGGGAWSVLHHAAPVRICFLICTQYVLYNKITSKIINEMIEQPGFLYFKNK